MAEGVQVRRQQKHGRRRRGNQHHHEQGREDSADPSFVETRDGIAPLADVPVEQPCDQEARDHEEDVDADIAAVKRRHAGVVEDDRDDGDGAQSVDVRPTGEAGV